MIDDEKKGIFSTDIYKNQYNGGNTLIEAPNEEELIFGETPYDKRLPEIKNLRMSEGGEEGKLFSRFLSKIEEEESRIVTSNRSQEEEEVNF